MTIAFDASSHLGTGGNFRGSWTHTPVGTPKGVVVCVSYQNIGIQRVTGVTYGGVALSLIGYQDQSSGAQSNSQMWLKSGGLPTGPQTVVVTGTNDDAGGSSAFTFTATGNVVQEGTTSGGSGNISVENATLATNGKVCCGVGCASSSSGAGSFSGTAAMASPEFNVFQRGWHAVQATPSSTQQAIGATSPTMNASWNAATFTDSIQPAGRSFGVIL